VGKAELAVVDKGAVQEEEVRSRVGKHQRKLQGEEGQGMARRGKQRRYFDHSQCMWGGVESRLGVWEVQQRRCREDARA
jgi:hypothetical protein